MKPRFTYPILFFVPCMATAALSSFVGALLGVAVFGLLLFGDYTHDFAEKAITAIMWAAPVITFPVLLHQSYTFGKLQESAGGIKRNHVLVSLISTIITIALLLLIKVWLS